MAAPERKLPTKEALIEAYVELCTEIGPAQVTIEKIAQKAGFSFGTARYHFVKEGTSILSESILYVIQRGVQYITAKIDRMKLEAGQGPVEAYLLANLDWVKNFRAHANFMVYFYSLCATHQELPVLASTFTEAGRARVEALLYEGIGRGLYSRPADLPRLAVQIHTLVLGSCLAAAVNPTPEALKLQEVSALASLKAILAES